MTKNLVEWLEERIKESEKFIAELDATDKLLGSPQPGLDVSRQFHLLLIRNAKSAIKSGEAVLCVEAAKAYGWGA